MKIRRLAWLSALSALLGVAAIATALFVGVPLQGELPTLGTSVEVQVTNSTSLQTIPVVKNGRVAWTGFDSAGRSNIFVYDIATKATTQITSSGSAILEAMDGNTVVYSDLGTPGCQVGGVTRTCFNIFAYDLVAGTTTQLTNDPANQLRPMISGNTVVWEDYRNGPTNPDIYGISLAGGPEFPISTNPGSQHNPSISGTLVAWQDERNGTPNVFAVDLTNPGTEIAVATGAVDAESPRVDAGRIVYSKKTAGGFYNTFVWDAVNSERQVSSCSCNETFPRISGNTVIWEDDRNRAMTGIDLYGKDLTNLAAPDTAIDTEPLDQTLHDVDGTNVVFVDARTGTQNVFLITTPVCAPPPTGMANWWPGEGNANDLIGGVNGTTSGTVNFASGEVGRAFSFDGSGGSVDFGSSVGNVGGSDFTVAFWLQTSSTAVQAIVSKRQTCDYGSFWDVRVGYPQAGHVFFEVDQDSVANWTPVYGNKAVNDDLFHHVAVVRQGATAAIYIDGALDSSSSATSTAYISNTADMKGGNEVCASFPGTQPLAGLLDELQLFNRALSAAEIQAIFVAGSAGVCPLPGDFSLSSIPPVTISLGGSASPSTTVKSLNGFNSPVTLSVSAPPTGVSASFATNPVTPPSGGSASSTLNIGAGPSVTPSAFTLTVTGTSGSLTHSTTASVTVTADTSSISNVIGNLLSAGCIDNSGIGTALTSKLSAAQAAISSGNIQTAINILTALKSQLQAQSGKHIATSCAIGGVTFNPVTVLLMGVQSLIDSLKVTLTPNPITGYVVDSSSLGVSGATVSILDLTNNTVATATTDITGFYLFATTGVLASGSSYTVRVTTFPPGFTMSTPASQTFTWQGTATALSNFLVN